jgi:hypothetical protein
VGACVVGSVVTSPEGVASNEGSPDGLTLTDGDGTRVDDPPAMKVAGSSNVSTGRPDRAPWLNAVQICAGNEPPVTLDSPPVPSRVTLLPFLSDLAIITAVDNCGVYPTYHADMLLSVVPVLPAEGRPRPSAVVPVPTLTTCWRA